MKSFLVILALIASPLFASNLDGPRRGFHINPELPPKLMAGQVAELSGEYCLWHLPADEIKNPKCKKVKEDQFETHAYFPDPFTEVTSEVAITKKLAGGSMPILILLL